MKFIGIIPARYASTRFMGKPLIDIGGKTMIQRVYEQASKALDLVVVATDDERIRDEIKKNGGHVVMTSESHRSGTDRCSEAADFMVTTQLMDYKDVIIVNIQGDEPFIQPQQIAQLKSCFVDETVQIATLIKEIKSTEEIFNTDMPKVVINKFKEAMYFSRSPIPFIRGTEKTEWQSKHLFYKHIGIYAYRYEILKQLTRIEVSSLELTESLEQNRWLENGYKIRTEVTDFENIGIDTPQDLERIKHLL